MNDSERERLADKVESEGFDYAIVEYGGSITDPEFKRLREAYLKAGRAVAEYLEIDI